MRETLKKFATRFGASHVKLLSGAEIKAWLASEPLAVKTRNRHFGYIRNVFSLSEEWNLIDGIPMIRTKVVELRHDHFSGQCFRPGRTFLRVREKQLPKDCVIEQLPKARLISPNCATQFRCQRNLILKS
jgi:hypothetical protein